MLVLLGTGDASDTVIFMGLEFREGFSVACLCSQLPLLVNSSGWVLSACGLRLFVLLVQLRGADNSEKCLFQVIYEQLYWETREIHQSSPQIPVAISRTLNPAHLEASFARHPRKTFSWAILHLQDASSGRVCLCLYLLLWVCWFILKEVNVTG